MGNFKQGIYEVKNKDKYMGQKDPRYLSSYELKLFEFCDNHRDVVKWGSEVVVVPYYNPIKEKKSRYMVDLYVEYLDKNKELHKELIEIKPKLQTQPPSKKGNKKQSTRALEESRWIQNTAKWEAAKIYAEERGCVFKLLTEEQIFK